MRMCCCECKCVSLCPAQPSPYNRPLKVMAGSLCSNIARNTAQVLTSLVEALSTEKTSPVPKNDQLLLLEEAVELFHRCLTLQEFNYAESHARDEAAAAAHL